MSETTKNDPLATNIGDDVIAAALQSVERRAPKADEPAAAATTAPEAAASEGDGALRAQLLEARQALRQREAELEASQAMGRQTLEKLKDQHERMLRAAADLENFKKRAARERDEALKYGQERLLRDLLPVIDNLDRGIEHANSPADFEGLKTGIKMTRKLFEDTLARYGVKGFSAVGQPFDPNLHEAVQSVESDAAPGSVVNEMVRGYTLHERLMRPAMVIVARARPAAAPPAAESAAAAASVESTSSGTGEGTPAPAETIAPDKN